MSASQAEPIQWFYEDKGQKKGPVTEEAIAQLIRVSTLSGSTPVWKQGFADWTAVQNTDLRAHLDTTSPPPLSGEHINNKVVWTLAFAPLLGGFLEWGLAEILYRGDDSAVESAMNNGTLWFVTLLLNIALAFFDEKLLTKAGHNTSKFKGWLWIVPVYLYQRAKATKQSIAYFIVWIVCFLVNLGMYA